MEFTELTDYSIPAGTLTEWLPCAEEDAWRQDPRPASYIHEAHLRRSADPRSGEGRESWLGTAFEIAGPIDTEVFGRALQRWIDRHEPLRSQAMFTSKGNPASALIRRTAPPGKVAVRRVQHDPADSATIRTQLHLLFDDYTTPQLWPAYVFATLAHDSADPEEESGGSGAFTVFFGADHSIIDGYSIVLVAHEITALYEEERTGRPADLFPVGSYIDFGASERADVHDIDADHEAVRIWRETLRESGGAVPGFPLPIGRRTTGTTPQKRLSERWFDSEDATRFSERCRDADVGFFAGVLACFGQATTDLTGADRFRTVVPSHTRTGPMWAGSLGWFVGLRPIDLGLEGSPGFVTLAGRAAQELRRTRASARIPFDKVGELLGVPIRPRFLVSYMDVRFVPMAAQWPEANARALRSRSYTHDVYVWINRTPEGINVSARFPDNPEAAANVPEFLDRVRDLMRRLNTSGPWAPDLENHELPATGR
ncbi:condensation domain-containing protein [Rhodococcus sp. SMB37]|uniref:condensation domain-containing protein n=1 Tax=Rhodococcus sp. SMB37 TaxID=2512213 RepID=UPI00104328DB|nr:condensation domain-containing protein [Rhodococcus sp. SMB37]TCN57164.1 condensation domain-containing protein [Rhodococcus sp. SMB37]